MKRIIDIAISSLGLIVAGPMMLIVAMLIKLDTPGPIFYRGIRAGLFGNPFLIYKFRTLMPDTEKPGGDTTALNDPRITGVGNFLRKYKVDELPQLINVIKGEMSIVGPRPELLAYTDKYRDAEKCILNVKPGITDLSSIEFNSLEEWVGAEDANKVFEESILPRKNQLRVKYVQQRSLWLDIKIIFKTLFVVLAKVINHRVQG